ncbi:glycosyltransferase [Mucilaginibacter terrae]|uniref:Streptomycin biosynthesis protein StrF domain-containing protein n=1 Tax=Mucilaginibacter terrae TaxID=1955052 RepID=A0ABU3GW01_9SPHI|nr:glycosyltransferase [Mucilaginibacter terrae]MDT3403943.1 hypothetical protein [Mucilaginibacter terrae]
MISVIISSVNKTMLANVSQNIADTIGVPFEIIAIDNSKGKRGICAVYNEGASRAKYNIVCFAHEDIAIKTQNWGKTIIDLFNQNTQIGLVGVLGSSYKPLSPSGWVGMQAEDTYYINIIQGFKYSNREAYLTCRNPNNAAFEPVACVDGVWFCTTRQVLEKVSFDENTFKGFHAYDLDFSMAVRQYYEVVVTYEVLLHHFSEGNFNKDWLINVLKFQEKWIDKLPVAVKKISYSQRLSIEKYTFRVFVDNLIKSGIPKSVAYKVLWQNNVFLKKFPSLFLKLHNFIPKAYKAARTEGRI